MKIQKSFLALTAAVLTIPAALHAAPEVKAITERMRSFIDSKEIAGAVTLVTDEEKTVHFSATGMSDIAGQKPMAEDAIFWIASMTKPVTATAVMMLQEEGLLSIDDPVVKYLPEFSGLKEITIKQCLNHTSGLAEVTADEAKGIDTLEEFIPLFVGKPLKFPPGTKWEYCQTGINTLGRIVEVVSRKSFPKFLDDRLFGPLGMKDTTFYLDEDQVARLATSYSRTQSGALEPAGLRHLNGKSPISRDRYPMANGGLFSTAADYAKFARMILRSGELDGKRYLKPESVSAMSGVATGDLTTGFTPGNGWGLGWCVIREPQGVTATLSPGTFGHGGLYGTQAWIDPVKKRVQLLLVQRANFSNGDASDVRKGFHEAAANIP